MDNRIDTFDQDVAKPVKNPLDLKPKGTCWYCNQPVDNVRRFCNKICADDYRMEEETFSVPVK